MELDKCGDAEHSVEMQTALKRFEDVCNSLENEHTKLLELEKRRQKLNDDLERLRNEITQEKKHFRSVIDEQLVSDVQDNKQNYENEELRELCDSMTLDTDAIKEYIAKRKDELTSHEESPNESADDTDDLTSGAHNFD